jgi:hypothetical protein
VQSKTVNGLGGAEGYFWPMHFHTGPSKPPSKGLNVKQKTWMTISNGFVYASEEASFEADGTTTNLFRIDDDGVKAGTIYIYHPKMSFVTDEHTEIPISGAKLKIGSMIGNSGNGPTNAVGMRSRDSTSILIESDKNARISTKENVYITTGNENGEKDNSKAWLELNGVGEIGIKSWAIHGYYAFRTIEDVNSSFKALNGFGLDVSPTWLGSDVGSPEHNIVLVNTEATGTTGIHLIVSGTAHPDGSTQSGEVCLVG